MNKSTHYVWWLGGLSFCVLLYLLGPILTPFLIAAIMAYIANPLVNKVCALRFGNSNTKFHYRPNRITATLLVMLLLFTVLILLLLIAVPILQREVLLVLAKIPVYFNHATLMLDPWLQTFWGSTQR